MSLFYHLKEWGARGPWYPGENATLEQFLRAAPLRELDNDQTRRISGMHPAFGRCTGAMLEVAQRNLEERFSLVGLTERFDEMLHRAREVLGWTCERIESWEVVNDRRPPVSEISTEARSLIVDRNRAIRRRPQRRRRP